MALPRGRPAPATKLKTIDISEFLPPHPPQQRPPTAGQYYTARSVHFEAEDHGIFYVTGYGNVVSDEELKGILDQARELFGKLSEEEKAAIGVGREGGDGARGYQKLGENVTQGARDWHEGYDLYAPFPARLRDSCRPGETVLRGENPWPPESKLPQFRETVEKYVEKMKVIAKAIVWANGMGCQILTTELDELINVTNESFWVMRMISYPPLPEDHEGYSCGDHKDYGCYTLLHCDDTPGSLQVWGRATDGGPEEWITVDPKPGCMVVNIGEMWETWTAGAYKAARHRVVHKGPGQRLSCPFFYEPAFDAKVKPLGTLMRWKDVDPRRKEFVAKGLEHKVIDYGEFLEAKVKGNFDLEGDDAKTETPKEPKGKEKAVEQ